MISPFSKYGSGFHGFFFFFFFFFLVGMGDKWALAPGDSSSVALGPTASTSQGASSLVNWYVDVIGLAKSSRPSAFIVGSVILVPDR